MENLRNTFPFPFTPYGIQNDFMKMLYEVIEKKQIGIFESPTGTGKSMSIICGALAWLADNDRNIRQGSSSNTNDAKNEKISKTNKENQSSDFDWINEYSQNKEKREQESKEKVTLHYMTKRDSTLKRIRRQEKQNSLQFGEPSRKRKRFMKNTDNDEALLELMKYSKRLLENTTGTDTDITPEEEHFLLDEYQSEDEDSGSKIKHGKDKDEDAQIQKIYYCSRTHSQLTQFIREVKKSPYVSNVDCLEENKEFFTTLVTLASRKSLCINDKVKKLGSVQLINDACLDMQKKSSKSKENKEKSKSKSKKKSSCPYYKNLENIEELHDHVLAKVIDIEEVVKKGKDLVACPYYAQRRALPLAQLVVIPYQILLHEATRKASGIDLTDAVIVVDEAHNLVDTITNIHSVQVTLSQIRKAESQLTQYVTKYSKRLKAKNIFYIRQILFVLTAMQTVLTNKFSKLDNDQSTTRLMTVNEFLFKCNIEHINLFKVIQYCERSMISRKLNGFVELSESYQTKENISKDFKLETVTSMRSPLQHIESFFLSLTSENIDGRITVTTTQESSVKFVLLNPAAQFSDIVKKCRSLIVAGGTMKPTSCFVDQLLIPTGVERSRIVEFSCGHVIENDQLLPAVLGNGPGGVPLEFTFDKRNNTAMTNDLGRLISNMCNIIPGGIVCFFPSYAYEEFVYKIWKHSGILAKIEMKKKIFREPKKSTDVDKVLNEYSNCIHKIKTSKIQQLTGSILFSVVGGKMSEGINFSDDLGRCVVMIGMPYPNLHSPELKEKMAYLNNNLAKDSNGKSAGEVYYENLCMKAVNQSVGRAIRHKGDHATIILADKRYAKKNVQEQLPGWIKDKLQVFERFGQCFASVRNFFQAKKKENG